MCLQSRLTTFKEITNYQAIAMMKDISFILLAFLEKKQKNIHKSLSNDLFFSHY